VSGGVVDIFPVILPPFGMTSVGRHPREAHGATRRHSCMEAGSQTQGQQFAQLDDAAPA